MTSLEKKLLSLNLALVLLFLCVQPAFAADTERADSTEPLQSEASAATEEHLRRQEPQNEIATQSASDEDAYYICVGNTWFRSDENHSGDGWTYYAAWQELFLDGYHGSGISASGDLSVYVGGDSIIEGTELSDIGEDGISVTGFLRLTIFSDSHLKVTGGFGSNQGGDALYGRAGVDIWGNGSYEAIGGSSNGTGGCGVHSDSVYVGADGTLQGGTGATGGAGVFFYTSCEFYAVNATIRGGAGRDGYAIQSEDGSDWYYSIHMIKTGNEYEIRLVVKQYTLMLYGNGGHKSNYATAEALTAYYPEYYSLIDHRFEQDGYEQVGWLDDTEVLPLDTVFTPTTNTSLRAYWEPVKAGDILLQGLSGYFDTEKTYRKYSDQYVELPKQLNYPDGSTLLAWSDQLEVTPLDSSVYAGAWYCGGDVVKQDTAATKVLYACPQNGFGTAIYHPTKGAVKSGGTVIIQGEYSSMVSPTDLRAYTLDASYLTAPDGYELAGWSTSPEAKTVDYPLNGRLFVEKRNIQHLYAVWKGIEYSKEVATGCTVTSVPVEEQVQVTLDQNWCETNEVQQGFCALYDEHGKLISVSFGKQTGEQGITLEMQYREDETPKTCKIFGVKDQNIPASGALQCDLAELSKQQ